MRVLSVVAGKWGHTLNVREGLLGGVAIDATGTPLPAETEKMARQADAVFMGAFGAPKFDSLPPSERPEAGLLALRKRMEVYANLRPVTSHKALLDASPLKNH